MYWAYLYATYLGQVKKLSIRWKIIIVVFYKVWLRGVLINYFKYFRHNLWFRHELIIKIFQKTAVKKSKKKITVMYSDLYLIDCTVDVLSYIQISTLMHYIHGISVSIHWYSYQHIYYDHLNYLSFNESLHHVMYVRRLNDHRLACGWTRYNFFKPNEMVDDIHD